MPECTDSKCPIHGKISVRGNVFSGTVVSAKPSKTAVVESTIVKFVPKYERYKKSKSRIYAHNPECINAKEDDVVKVGETRRLSKSKCFVILEVVGRVKKVEVEEDTFVEKRREKEAEKQEEKPGEQEKPEEKPSLEGQEGENLKGDEAGQKDEETSEAEEKKPKGEEEAKEKHEKGKEGKKPGSEEKKGKEVDKE